MLGKTHEVTAPTGLLKVMESAVAVQESPEGLDYTIVLQRSCMDCTPMGMAERPGRSKCRGIRHPAKGAIRSLSFRYYTQTRTREHTNKRCMRSEG